MVVFVDYDWDSYDDAQPHHPGTILHSYVQPNKAGDVRALEAHYTDPRYPSGNDPNVIYESDYSAESSRSLDTLNVNSFSRCMNCYPYGPFTHPNPCEIT